MGDLYGVDTRDSECNGKERISRYICHCSSARDRGWRGLGYGARMSKLADLMRAQYPEGWNPGEGKQARRQQQRRDLDLA
jgi:hypothetical protein